jgi:hypothetical protein
MPVFVIENRAHGNRATCPLQDIQFAFGANDPATIGRLEWLRDVLGPALGEAVRQLGGVELMPIAEKALASGDELHDRVAASSAYFTRELTLGLVRAGLPGERLLDVLDYLAHDVMADWTFESPWIGACKAMLDAADGIERSTIVTAMVGNGTTFGVRISGLPGRWFVAPAPTIVGAYFETYTVADALGEMGDSTTIDTFGCGGPALAAAPAHMPLTGRRASEALELTRRAHEIASARHERLEIPALDFEGIPVGFDARRIVETGTLPIMAVGIGHRTPGVGFIGLGISEAPLACFEQALAAFEERHAT